MSNQQCTISGTVSDSGAVVFSGKVIVTLDAPLIIESLTPDKVLYEIPKEFTITSGVLSLQLWESESQSITYKFELYKGVETTPFKTFHAVVPDAATYQWAQLDPTGITTDRLATGALRVGKAILTDPLLSTDLKKVLGIYRQSTKPTATANGDVWVKSDSGMIFVWNSTLSQWVSDPYPVSITLSNLSATNATVVSPECVYNYGGVDGLGGGGNLLLEGLNIRWNVVSAPLGTGNRWDIQPGYRLSSQSSLTSLGSAVNTFSSGVAVSTLGRNNQSFTLQRFDAGDLEFFGVTSTKTGSPGNLNVSVTFLLRFGFPRD